MPDALMRATSARTPSMVGCSAGRGASARCPGRCVVVVLAGDTETRRVADDDGGDVADQNRVAADLRQHGVLQMSIERISPTPRTRPIARLD